MIFRIQTVLLAMFFAGPMMAQSISFGENERLDALFATLQSEDGSAAESEILLIFRQSGSDAMDLLLKRGYDALDAGALRDAVWHFSALIDHAPEFGEAYGGRAIAFYELGELDMALQDIHTTLTYNPRQFRALVGLGFIQEELGNLGEALSAYKIAFQLNPHMDGLTDAIERVESQISILH